MNDAQNVYGRTFYSEDHAVIANHKVPVFRLKQRILWNGGATIRHPLKSANLRFKLRNKPRRIFYGIPSNQNPYFCEIGFGDSGNLNAVLCGQL